MTNYRIYKIETYPSASVTSSVSSKAWGVKKYFKININGKL